MSLIKRPVLKRFEEYAALELEVMKLVFFSVAARTAERVRACKREQAQAILKECLFLSEPLPWMGETETKAQAFKDLLGLAERVDALIELRKASCRCGGEKAKAA